MKVYKLVELLLGIGDTDKQGYIVSCYNSGKIQEIYKGTGGTVGIGGIVGYNYNGVIKNCYNTGEVISERDGFIEDIVGFSPSSSDVENCYYLSNSRDNKYGIRYTTSSMKSSSFIDKLNKGDKYPFIVDEGNINEGYPILFWQSNNENVIIQYNENSSLYARQDTSKSNEDNTNKIEESKYEESDEYTNEYISMDKDAISKESYNNSEYSNKEHTIRTLIVVCLFALIISILMIFIIYKN